VGSRFFWGQDVLRGGCSFRSSFCFFSLSKWGFFSCLLGLPHPFLVLQNVAVLIFHLVALVGWNLPCRSRALGLISFLIFLFFFDDVICVPFTSSLPFFCRHNARSNVPHVTRPSCFVVFEKKITLVPVWIMRNRMNDFDSYLERCSFSSFPDQMYCRMLFRVFLLRKPESDFLLLQGCRCFCGLEMRLRKKSHLPRSHTCKQSFKYLFLFHYGPFPNTLYKVQTFHFSDASLHGTS